MEQANSDQNAFDYHGNAHLFEGILSRRVISYLIDFAIVTVLSGILMAALFILGIPTIGLAWLLLPSAFPIVVFIYIATTLGSERASTYGMRMIGIEARMTDGRKPYALIAVFHTLAFYFSVTILTPLILLLGFFTSKQRLMHDFLSGMIFVNRDALPADNN